VIRAQRISSTATAAAIDCQDRSAVSAGTPSRAARARRRVAEQDRATCPTDTLRLRPAMAGIEKLKQSRNIPLNNPYTPFHNHEPSRIKVAEDEILYKYFIEIDNKSRREASKKATPPI
jgi:hypothetical protein